MAAEEDEDALIAKKHEALKQKQQETVINCEGGDLLIMPNTPVQIFGKTPNGLVKAQFGEEMVFVCSTEMTIKEI